MYLSDKQSNDKNLICELAGQALATPVTQLDQLGGSISYNYEVNHRYILKLPSERTFPNSWVLQERYMPILQKYLTYQIPQPQTKVVWTKDKTQSFMAMSYPKIDGNCVGDTFEFAQKDRPFKVRFLEQLSDAANQLHSIPLSKIPLKIPTKEEEFQECFFSDTISKGSSYLKRKIIHALFHDPFFGLDKSADKTDVLAHSDLHSGNVLFNDKNELVALLDFDTLGCGDRFWEFRPKLYADSQDTSLFREIYSFRTGHRINFNDIYAMHQLFYFGQLLASAFATYDALSPAQNIKRLKSHLKEKNKMMRSIQRAFKSL